MGKFDPQLLAGFEASLADDSRVVHVDDEELRRIAGAETRRRCAGIKLAAQVVGMTVAMGDGGSDAELLATLEAIMLRVGDVRHLGLEVLGIRAGVDDYVPAFNVLTSIALDVVTQEWKWGQIKPEQDHHLSAGVLAKVFESAISNQMLDDQFVGSDLDLDLTRRLCVLEVTAGMLRVVNYFDYYQADYQVFVSNLVDAVAHQAELQARALIPLGAIDFTAQAVLQRVYSVSSALMVEIDKLHAAQDVLHLRSLASMERSIMLAQYESLGGMSYDHLIKAHARAFARMTEIAEVIFESQSRR